MRLLLFDIDGTLVDTGGIGRSSLQEGMLLESCRVFDMSAGNQGE
jgi:phosphoglycolate phosphatase-like HAD superfamily hydrolase